MLIGTGEFAKNPAPRTRGSGRILSLLVVAIDLTSGVSLASASPGSRSYFFATSEACAASGSFSKPECANAFVNAEAEMRAHAPNFGTKFACEIRFRLCGSDPSASEPSEHEQLARGSFSPIMLGVEISVQSDGRVVTPVIAVMPPPGTFRACPISQREFGNTVVSTLGHAQILRADRFERIKAQFDQPSVGTEQMQDPGTRARRREWLKSLPFVE